MTAGAKPVRGFVRNSWYAAALSREIGRHLFARRILDEPLVMYRQADGAPVALLDRCAHKLAPLSRGLLVDDAVQCPYHGLRYDAAGACVHVPGQDRIPPGARVRSFRVAERYGFVWVWMGDAARADAQPLVEVRRFGEPGWSSSGAQYQYHRANFVNVAENLMDPAHTTFVHRKTIGVSGADAVPVRVEERTDHVLAYRWVENTPPPPLDRAAGGFAGMVDRCQYYYFYPPGVSLVDVCTINAGEAHAEENKDRGMRAFSYKFLTPETADRTHFFWLQVRNYQTGDAAAGEKLVTAMAETFEEDNAIYSAIQREQDATGRVQFTGLEIDRAPAMIRRKIRRMIEAEQA